MQSGKFTVKIILKGVESAFDNADIIELNIVEDIFSWCMCGSIIFYDKMGFTELLEITGKDPIIVMWEEEGIKREKIFLIYNYDKIIEEISIDSSVTKVMWYFIEPVYMSLTNRKYSKAWNKNISNSTIIKDISKNYLNIDTNNFKKFEEVVEYTDNFYIPYWTPAESLRWIMHRSSGSESLLPGYLFYSNTLGNNFVTLETLVRNTDRERDLFGKKIRYIFSGAGEDYNKILSWYVDPPDMISFKYLSGSIKHGYISNGKYLLSNRYTYDDAINKYSLLGKTSLFPDISEPSTNVTLEAETDEKIIDNLFYDEFIRRYSKQFAVGLVVKGHTRRYAGMIIDVLWKSADAKRKTHKMYEGLYLVRSITHQFTSGLNVTPPYRQLMICVKTGYNTIEDTMLKRTKKGKNITDIYVSKG